MPFTLAHPAAIIPVFKIAGRHSSLSALVIGSMTPDAVYFLPLGIGGRASHSLPALFWFCIPVGFIAYVMFHSVVKRPAAELLPLAVFSRLPAQVQPARWSGPSPPGMVICSLFVGALTHVTWDAFTHAHSSVVLGMDMLRAVVGTVGDYPVPLYKLLQHASSLAGLTALSLSIRGWCMHAPPVSDLPCALAARLPARTRLTIIAAVIATGLVFAVARGALASHRTVEDIVVKMTVGGMVGAGIAFAAFCIGWHILVARRSGYA